MESDSVGLKNENPIDGRLSSNMRSYSTDISLLERQTDTFVRWHCCTVNRNSTDVDITESPTPDPAAVSTNVKKVTSPAVEHINRSPPDEQCSTAC